MTDSETYMRRCLQLAEMGLGKVAPNPMVGAVLVHNNTIIGEGYHEQFGQAHAEVNAINSVPKELEHLIPDSTLYVNLEPCCHQGKTPPCVDLILEKKIRKVVVGSLDPNPLVAGKGIAKLRANGVEVIENCLKEECDFTNRRFFCFHRNKRPYIILKWAQSADGFIAPIEDKPHWLTNDLSKRLVHRWRSEEQAIIVGKNTVNIDNPQLNVRLWQGNNPLRITIDRTLSLHTDLHFFDGSSPTLIFNEIKDDKTENMEYVKIDFTKAIWQQINEQLYQRNILSVIIEGGAKLLSNCIAANNWDEARIFTVKERLNEGIPAPHLVRKQTKEPQNIEGDTLTISLQI